MTAQKSVVLFHSILGLRRAERDIADAFERAGISATIPDLFAGRVAKTYPDGFRMKDEIGDALILRRAEQALASAPADAILAGVSFGAFLIGRLWQDRRYMPGALLISGVAPWMKSPRCGLPVSVHIARPDPFDDEEFFAQWANEADHAALQLYRYDNVGHYFLDRDLPDYDAAAAALCMQRSVEFLARLS
jgi:dienelactone hydrolase